jgi:hypothetical protein
MQESYPKVQVHIPQHQTITTHKGVSLSRKSTKQSITQHLDGEYARRIQQSNMVYTINQATHYTPMLGAPKEQCPYVTLKVLEILHTHL